MKRKGIVIFCCVALLTTALLYPVGQSIEAQANQNVPELKSFPSGQYNLKLSDGSTIQNVRGIHVVRCQGRDLLLARSGDPVTGQEHFINPDHVMTFMKINNAK